MISTLVLAVAACSWADPGHARFTGTDAAVDDYKDIPAPVRAVLRERIRKHDYNDIAEIRSDRIVGASNYDDLRDMHFGAKGMCKTVTRQWKPSHVERGLVYCEGETCVIVPTVCNNIARVTRRRGDSPGFASALQNEAASFAGAQTQVAEAGALPGGGGVGDPGASLDNMAPTGAGISQPTSFASGSTGGTTGFTGSSVPVLGPGQGFLGGGGLLIPQVGAVGSIPEPATWALIAAGMAGVGFATRRRRDA